MNERRFRALILLFCIHIMKKEHALCFHASIGRKWVGGWVGG